MNIDLLAEQIDLEPDEYKKLIEIFLDSTSANLKALRHALGVGDASQVAFVAHDIKGASLSLGLTEIAKLAGDIEKIARMATQSELIQKAEAIQALCNTLAGQLKNAGISYNQGVEEEEMDKNNTILVVDNQPEFLSLMTKILQKRPYRVLLAKDGMSALELLKAHSPGIIFVDLVMPNIAGDKLCQIIRGMPDHKNVFIALITAIAQEQKINFISLGANACIAKGPFDKMRDNVLFVIDKFEQGDLADLDSHIIGVEEVDSRTITSELIFSNKHLEDILSSMAEGVMELDHDGRIVYANRAALSILGLPEEKALSMRFLEFFAEPHLKQVQCLLDIIAKNKTPQEISQESPVIMNEREIAMHLLPIVGSMGGSIVVIFRDVTERRQMEERLRLSNKMEAIGSLAGGIAHDFNNILMVIQGNAQLMAMDLDHSGLHYELVKEVETQTARGADLTRQLLAFARGGKYEIKYLNLNHLVEATSTAFGRTRKDINIYCNLSKKIEPIKADKSQIEQLLMNFYLNAGHAMPDGGSLYLETSVISSMELTGKPYQPESDSYTVLTIRDTGVGMDKKTLDRIFDPFFTTINMGRGTGLGLAAGYGIIKAHKGYIDVSSEKGRGTTFIIYLPASPSEKPAQNDLPAVIVTGTGTILLVDDEAPVLKVGARTLRRLGYDVIEAMSGSQAIEIFKKEKDHIDLVILDMIMPDMSGGKVFDLLMEIDPSVRILLCTGYSLEGEATEIMARGCDGFIQKPFTIEGISQKIRDVMAIS
ncbi:MAG: response regulator [Pseudomonadota bacterium]